MSRRDGFSLIEVLCAILILGVCLVGVMEGITLSLKSSKQAHFHTSAALLAAGQIETLRADGYLYEGEEEGDFGEAAPLYTWTRRVEENDLDGLYDVTVEVKLKSTEQTVCELSTRLFEMPMDSMFDTNETSAESRGLRRAPFDPRRAPGRRRP